MDDHDERAHRAAEAYRRVSASELTTLDAFAEALNASGYPADLDALRRGNQELRQSMERYRAELTKVNGENARLVSEGREVGTALSEVIVAFQAWCAVTCGPSVWPPR
jgi:hypothetical protein